MIVIESAEKNVRCECCNRKLKVGIQTNVFGIIGADCLISKLKENHKRWNTGKPSAAWLRELAMIKATKNSNWINRRGYEDRVFTFEAA